MKEKLLAAATMLEVFAQDERGGHFEEYTFLRSIVGETIYAQGGSFSLDKG